MYLFVTFYCTYSEWEPGRRNKITLSLIDKLKGLALARFRLFCFFALSLMPNNIILPTNSDTNCCYLFYLPLFLVLPCPINISVKRTGIWRSINGQHTPTLLEEVLDRRRTYFTYQQKEIISSFGLLKFFLKSLKFVCLFASFKTHLVCPGSNVDVIYAVSFKF